MTHVTHWGRTMTSKPARSGFALSLLSLAVSGAFAQSAPAPSAAASAPAAKGEAAAEPATSLETVTVSATRRRELIREVPLAISSVPAERLAETGAKSLNDFLASQPGVVLQNSGIADGAGFVIIRGLTAGQDTNSPTTVYLDDTPLGIGVPFDINLLDLNRFEVLRGPQGTLYGSSALGGVVKYVTNPADTTEFGGKVGIGLSRTQGGGFNSLGSAVLNMPLKQDVAAVRVAVFGSRDNGYVDATGPVGQEDVNSKKARGARLSTLVTPTRELEVRLTALTQTRESDGNDRILYGVDTRAPVAGDLVYTLLSVREPRENRRNLFSATVEYDLGWARFSSITSYQTAKDTLTTDFTPLGALFGLDTARSFDVTENKKTNQEFRLVSQTAGAFEWLAGFFFDKVDLQSDSDLAGTAGTVVVPFGGSQAQRDYEEKAVYGNVTWNLTSSLALTGGLRYARYDQTDNVVQTGLPSTTIEFGESATTYLLAAKYKLTDQSNVYLRAASGYRPGGANFSSVDPLTGVTIPGAQPSYGTDEAWTYEAGYKASFPERRASIEAAVFQTNWKDLQLFTPGTPTVPGFTSNLGKARVRGLELSANVAPVSSLALGASLTLLEAELRSDAPGIGGVAGDRLPNAPKTAATLSARYGFALAGSAAFAGLNVGYVGARKLGFDAGASPNYELPAYTQVDLSGGVSFGRFDVGVYVRNAGDKRGQLGGSTSEQLTVGRTYIRVIEPRTLGVNLSASF